MLQTYAWPGNVRELKNVLESLVVQSGPVIAVEDLPVQASGGTVGAGSPDLGSPLPQDDDRSLRRHERKLILDALQKYKQVKLAAQAVGISRSTMYRKLKEYGIPHHEFT